MERDRNSKILAIIALTVAVIGLSLGFAAFSQTLTIHSSAEVKPDEDDFTNNVKFVTNDDSSEGTVAGVPGGDESGASGDTANLTATTISNIKAKFTKPGQEVTYTFKVKNESPYIAYLRSVTFNASSDEENPIKCTVITHDGQSEKDALEADVLAACGDIHVTVTVGSDPYTTSNSKITGHSLAAKTGSETVEVKIDYTGTNTADGDFAVEIGDIELNYASRDGTGA